MTGDNGWKCDRCKRQVDAKKRLQLRSLPNVMTVLLKRFRFGGLLGGKIDVAVEYPKVFDAGPYTCGDAASLVRAALSRASAATVTFTSRPSLQPRAATRYRLYGVLVHAGSSMQFGHYYCFVKAANGVWYEMNDASVRQVSEQTALRQRAYMLFYARDKAGVAAALAAEHPELLAKAKEKAQEKESDASDGAGAKGGEAAVAPAAPGVPFVPVAPSSAAATPVSQWGSLKGPGASTTEGEEAERALELGRTFADAPTGGFAAVASGAFDEVSALAEASRELQAVESAHGERRRAFLDELHQRGLPKKQRKALARDEAPTNARELAGVAAFAARWADAHAPTAPSASEAASPGSGDCESSGDGSDADAEQLTVQSPALARDLQPIVARPDSSDEEDGEQETSGPSPPLRAGSRPALAEEGDAPPARQRVGLAVKLMQRATLFLRRRRKQALVVDSKAPASGDGEGDGDYDAKSSSEDGSDSSEDEAEAEAREGEAKASPGSPNSEDEDEAEARGEKIKASTGSAPGEHERKRRRLVTSSLDVRAVSWRSTLPGASAKTKAWDAEDVVGGADQLKQREALLSRQIRAERTQAKARKLDKWDSALDKGRLRKVKGEVARRNREVHSSAPGSNAFHRAQERFRRAGRRMGKGKKRNRPPPSARL